MEVDLLERIICFINKAGVTVKKISLTETTFLPGIKIHCGELLVDLERLEHPGDLLHEAGHIALMTSAEKRTLIGDLTPYRTPGNDDELAVILWSYAALISLEISPEVVFHDAGYKGDAQWLIEQLEGGNYIGLPLLVWMGLCTQDAYPKMKQWLREDS